MKKMAKHLEASLERVLPRYSRICGPPITHATPHLWKTHRRCGFHLCPGFSLLRTRDRTCDLTSAETLPLLRFQTSQVSPLQRSSFRRNDSAPAAFILHLRPMPKSSSPHLRSFSHTCESAPVVTPPQVQKHQELETSAICISPNSIR